MFFRSLANPKSGLRLAHVSHTTVSLRRTMSSSTQPNLQQTSQLSEYASREVGASIIDLSVGQPGPALLPMDAIHAAASDRLGGGSRTDDAQFLLQYGPRQGYPSFRRDLASFLTGRYGGPVVGPDSLMATAGEHGQCGM